MPITVTNLLEHRTNVVRKLERQIRLNDADKIPHDKLSAQGHWSRGYRLGLIASLESSLDLIDSLILKENQYANLDNERYIVLCSTSDDLQRETSKFVNSMPEDITLKFISPPMEEEARKNFRNRTILGLSDSKDAGEDILENSKHENSAILSLMNISNLNVSTLDKSRKIMKSLCMSLDPCFLAFYDDDIHRVMKYIINVLKDITVRNSIDVKQILIDLKFKVRYRGKIYTMTEYLETLSKSVDGTLSEV